MGESRTRRQYRGVARPLESIHPIGKLKRTPAPIATKGVASLQIFRSEVRLSFQESRVAIAVCEGATNAQIAGVLGISEHTVKRHLKRMFDGLNITSRLELCLWGLQNTPALFDREWAAPMMHPKGCECSAPYCVAMRGKTYGASNGVTPHDDAVSRL